MGAGRGWGVRWRQGQEVQRDPPQMDPSRAGTLCLQGRVTQLQAWDPCTAAPSTSQISPTDTPDKPCRLHS